jgi:eukaryotic-like serine/threonine-protein kinase
MTICERCGATTTDDAALFCGICGAALPRIEGAGAGPAPPRGDQARLDPKTAPMAVVPDPPAAPRASAASVPSAAVPSAAPSGSRSGVIKPGPRAGAPRVSKSPRGSPEARPKGTIPEGPISAALKPIEMPPQAPADPAPQASARAAPPDDIPLAPPAGAEKRSKPAKHLPAGALVDKKYAVLRVLGEGGMGVVYLARDIHTGLDVVVKAVRPELAHRDDVRARTLAEGRALAQIDHPNVVHLRAVAVEGESLYLVMQYIDGESLDKIILRYHERGEKMPIAEALGLFRQIAAGVGAAHQEGVVHRDLKPANVLLRSKDRVAKVTDFGIALMPNESERHNTRGILGSLWYMSPEQVTGRRDLDQRVDIYALGILLYQMLVGSVPFDAKSDYEIMKLHAEAPMPLVAASRPDLPSAIDELVQRACAKDRETRFARCEEMIAAVDRMLGGPSLTISGVSSPAISTSALLGSSTPWDVATPLPGSLSAALPSASTPQPGTSTPLPGVSTPQPLPSAQPQEAQPPSAIAVTASHPGDAPNAGDARPPTKKRRWPWVALAFVVIAGGGAGAAAGFGLIPGVPGLWKLPDSLPFTASTAASSKPSATASASAVASAPPTPASELAPLAGAWVGNGRELDAVLVGNDLEFRVKKAEQFAPQGYAVGEARFVLRPTSDARVFAVEDRIRPVPPTGKSYDPRARGTCQEVWTGAGSEPLRARFDGTRLSVEFAKIEPGPMNFTVLGARVTSCVGLHALKASKVVSVLTRP